MAVQLHINHKHQLTENSKIICCIKGSKFQLTDNDLFVICVVCYPDNEVTATKLSCALRASIMSVYCKEGIKEIPHQGANYKKILRLSYDVIISQV